MNGIFVHGIDVYIYRYNHDFSSVWRLNGKALAGGEIGVENGHSVIYTYMVNSVMPVISYRCSYISNFMDISF